MRKMEEVIYKIMGLATSNPRYMKILKRIIEIEEACEKGNYRSKGLSDSDCYIIKSIGWQWHHVQAWPTELMKLVREGIIKITYKSRRYTHYKLVNRDLVKRALGIKS